MSDIRIGMLFILLLIVVPPIAILRTKYVSPKKRLFWFLVSLLGLLVGLLWRYIDIQRALRASTEAEQTRIFLSTPPLASFIFSYWSLMALLLFKILNSPKKKNGLG